MSEVAEKTAEKRVVILNPQSIGLRENKRQDWAAEAEVGTTVEDVLDPQYWAHMSSQFEPYARVEVLEETGAWMVELIVINSGRNWAQVNLLHSHELVKRSETMPAATKHKVEWKGVSLKFCVIRLADSEMIQKNLPSKAAAADWLAGYERSTS